MKRNVPVGGAAQTLSGGGVGLWSLCRQTPGTPATFLSAVRSGDTRSRKITVHTPFSWTKESKKHGRLFGPVQ